MLQRIQLEIKLEMLIYDCDLNIYHLSGNVSLWPILDPLVYGRKDIGTEKKSFCATDRCFDLLGDWLIFLSPKGS